MGRGIGVDGSLGVKLLPRGLGVVVGGSGLGDVRLEDGKCAVEVLG